MSNFRVGQKVVCVDAEWHGWDSPLEERRVYTIKSVGFGRGLYGGNISDHVIVDLLEVINPDDADYPDSPPGFAGQRFRPVVTRKTDISIFQRMLNPQKLRTDA